MGLERHPDAAIGLSTYVELTAAATLTVNQQRVRVTAGAAMDLTLPPVGEAKGKIYSIIARNGATNATTVIDQGDSEVAVSDAMSSSPTTGVYYSDGTCWFKIE